MRYDWRALPMNLRTLAALALAVVVAAAPAEGHPAPFSYLDIRIGTGRIDLGIVAHVFDVAHDLPVDAQDRLLEPAFLREQTPAIVVLFKTRLHISADGQPVAPTSWSVAPLPDRQAIRLHASVELMAPAGAIAVEARMFPYDSAHQTFVNIYEERTLALQAILDAEKPGLDYYTGSPEGAVAVARRFAPVGIRHVLFGADHLVFVVGLLLLGGSARQMGGLLAAMAGGNLLAWLLTWMNVLHPPARVIEPALALGLVYLGADNLLVSGGRDLRMLIAFAFGLTHGFWFAVGLRTMDLPAATLAWSLLAFDGGVESAHVVALTVVGVAVSLLRGMFPAAATLAVTTGSVGVMVAGAYWFVQRVFFPAGLL